MTRQDTPDAQDAQDGDGGFVLGIDVGGTKTAVATGDLTGRILRTARFGTRAACGASESLQRALKAAATLCAETAAATGGRLLGAGVVSPGVVHDDHIAYAPNIPGWERLALPALVGDALGPVEVACANDVKAGGLAEARWGALRGADPGLFVSLGTGVGLAVVLGGRVLHGAHGAAGEIGYLLRGPEDRVGVASGRAPLEEYASGSGLARRGAALLGGTPTAEDLFASADPRARALVDDALDELAVHVANAAVTLDPRRVAVGGGMAASADRVLAALGARLREAVPYPPELVRAAYPQESALRGALALILDRVPPATGRADEAA